MKIAGEYEKSGECGCFEHDGYKFIFLLMMCQKQVHEKIKTGHAE